MYSNSGKHEIALQFAMKANKMLESLFKNELMANGGDAQNDKAIGENNLGLVTALASSYHNTGAEMEHLDRRDKCLKYYILAFSLSNKYIGADHFLTKDFQQSFIDAQNKFKAEKNREEMEVN